MSASIASLIANDSPFVLYRLPGEETVHCLYQKDKTVHTTTDFSEAGFVFAPFVAKTEKLYLPNTHRFSFIPEKKASIATAAIALPLTQKENFIKQVEAAITALARQSMEKVVLSNAFRLPYTGDALTVFERLLEQYPRAFVYYWSHPETGSWLGATPERFLQLEQQQLSTMALAGTLAATQTEWSPKEIHEQQLVVDAIVAGLSRHLSPDQIRVGERQTVQAGKLRHLCTHISADVQEVAMAALVEELHPTPAVGGLPKAAAVDYILKQEGYDRSYYTGYLGPFAAGEQANLFVNLRCAQFLPDAVQLYTGAGITAGSVPVREWEEICRKASTFLSVL